MKAGHVLADMPIPTFEDKYQAPAFMSPEDRLAQRFDEDPRPDLPNGVILTFQDYLFERIRGREESNEIDLRTSEYALHSLEDRDPAVGVVGEFGIGAPMLGIVAEELVALGVSEFLIVGGCGTLQPTVAPGDAIVVEDAIRDEGVSYHYLEDADTVAATPDLVASLENRLAQAGVNTHVGSTWTTDAFYRETTVEIDHYQRARILTVEMEAAALFAILEYRGGTAGALFTPFDQLTGESWEFTEIPPEERFETIFTIAAGVLEDRIEA